METINPTDINDRLNQIEQSMVTKDELNSVIETISILSNSDTMRQIRESEEEISNNDFREINSVEEI